MNNVGIMANQFPVEICPSQGTLDICGADGAMPLLSFGIIYVNSSLINHKT
jgi:hypothetical protein